MLLRLFVAYGVKQTYKQIFNTTFSYLTKHLCLFEFPVVASESIIISKAVMQSALLPL